MEELKDAALAPNSPDCVRDDAMTGVIRCSPSTSTLVAAVHERDVPASEVDSTAGQSFARRPSRVDDFQLGMGDHSGFDSSSNLRGQTSKSVRKLALKRDPSRSTSGLVQRSLSLPSFSHSRTSERPHLPSFDLLGIAAPRPDLFLKPNEHDPPDSLGTRSWTEHSSDPIDIQSGRSITSQGVSLDDSAGLGLLRAEIINAKRHLQPRQSCMSMLTPPDDSGTIDWSSKAIPSAAAMTSPNTSPNTHSTTPFVPFLGTALGSPAEVDIVSPFSTVSAGGFPVRPDVQTAPGLPDRSLNLQRSGQLRGDVSPSTRGGDHDQLETSDTQLWIEDYVQDLVSGVVTVGDPGYSVRVLSQALPCPGSHQIAFPIVINALHGKIPPNQMTSITVVHAVPSRFNLADMPSSPPGTPTSTSTGEDYFSTSIFSSAVPVCDYQDRKPTTPLPSSPCPLVPPASVHVSLLERYIPPGSTAESADLFNTEGPSLLVDRLAELSPEKGTLLFIYPTKRGGKSFANDYLGPILDPVLRSMMVVNDFSADFGGTIGRMTAVDSLRDFEPMKRRVLMLCNELSKSKATNIPRSTYSILQCSKQEVKVDRKIWSNWWVHQERARVRDGLGRYFRKARKLPDDADVMPINLLQDVLDAVGERPYENPLAPVGGIEVGVFVIRRSFHE
ncbi:MAG: hypothetical protein M1819_001087 [Sarea resinae]|nr:MAG: hypothetical protein M1819_001087 [Sarea resinae]